VKGVWRDPDATSRTFECLLGPQTRGGSDEGAWKIYSPMARPASSADANRTVPYPLLLLSGPRDTSARSTVPPAFRNKSFRSCHLTRYGSYDPTRSQEEVQ
jgi:hypothetical protein